MQRNDVVLCWNSNFSTARSCLNLIRKGPYSCPSSACYQTWNKNKIYVPTQYYVINIVRFHSPQGSKPSTMPDWMRNIHDKLRNSETHLNVRLFLAKVILNSESTFRPFASFRSCGAHPLLLPLLLLLLAPIVQVTTRTFSCIAGQCVLIDHAACSFYRVSSSPYTRVIAGYMLVQFCPSTTIPIAPVIARPCVCVPHTS